MARPGGQRNISSMGALSTVAKLSLGLAMAAIIWGAFLYARPAESFVGESSRIVFFHVPMAWIATLAFLLAAIHSAVYLKNSVDFLKFGDVTSGLYKAAVFGFIIALMGCYHGYNSKGGAQGVGAATTNAVVSAAILILAANYVMTSLFFGEGSR